MGVTLADILRQTSLTCERCDAGIEIHSYAEAITASWTGIEFASDMPNIMPGECDHTSGGYHLRRTVTGMSHLFCCVNER
jgi:hypothetical protein